MTKLRIDDAVPHNEADFLYEHDGSPNKSIGIRTRSASDVFPGNSNPGTATEFIMFRFEEPKTLADYPEFMQFLARLPKDAEQYFASSQDRRWVSDITRSSADHLTQTDPQTVLAFYFDRATCTPEVLNKAMEGLDLRPEWTMNDIALLLKRPEVKFERQVNDINRMISHDQDTMTIIVRKLDAFYQGSNQEPPFPFTVVRADDMTPTEIILDRSQLNWALDPLRSSFVPGRENGGILGRINQILGRGVANILEETAPERYESVIPQELLALMFMDAHNRPKGYEVYRSKPREEARNGNLAIMHFTPDSNAEYDRIANDLTAVFHQRNIGEPQLKRLADGRAELWLSREELAAFPKTLSRDGMGIEAGSPSR